MYPKIVTKINEVYSKGAITITSAFLAACDKKKCPREPNIPNNNKGIESNKEGKIKSFGKKHIDVNKRARE